MTTVLIDSVTSVTFQNGLLRVDCISIGPKGEQRPSATLLIPGNQFAGVLQNLGNAAKELDRLVRKQFHDQVQAAKAPTSQGEKELKADRQAKKK
jgi:hypothetical protein